MKQFLQLVAISAIIMLASVATNAQNVGIGTASPAQKLEIAGTTNTIRINGLTSGGSYYQAANANSSLLYVNSATGDLYSLPTGSSGTILTISAGGVPTWTVATAVTPAWNLTGNANGTYAFSATPINYFLGTTSATTGFQFGVAGANAGRIESANFGNTALGYQTLNSEANPEAMTAIGYQALKVNTGNFNTAVGYTAMGQSSGGNYNTGVGYQSLLNNAGTGNTALGAPSLAGGSLSGSNNVAVGRYSMGAVSTGSNNTGLGYNSNVTTGTITNATAIGANAVVNQSNALVLGSISGVNTATASTNVGIGTQTPAQALDVEGGNIQFGQALMPAGNAGTSGNILLSAGAATAPTWLANGSSGQVLQANGTGVPTWTTVAAVAPAWNLSGNSGVTYASNFIGTVSGTDQGLMFEVNGQVAGRVEDATSANGSNENTSLGYQALSVNTGANNTAIGYQALVANTSGSSNIAIGSGVLTTLTTGSNNVAIGNGALALAATNITDNIAIGTNALAAATKGGVQSSVAIGYNALANSTVGRNIAIGQSALSSNTTGVYNVAVGPLTLEDNIATSDNTAVGFAALDELGGFSSGGGNDNTAYGYEALGNFWGGSGNTAIGSGAEGPSSGNYENNITAVGFQALGVNPANNSTAVGYQALSQNSTGGINNSAFGYQAGVTSVNGNANTGGSYNTFIGSEAGPGNSSALVNATAIGAYAVVGENNAMVLGSISGVNGASASANIGIGTQTPAQALDVEGGNIQFGKALMPAGNAGVTGNILLSSGLNTAPTWLANGSTGTVLTSNGTGAPTWTTPAATSATAWQLTGNSGTTPGTNFVGTTDNNALEFKTNNTFSGILDPTNQNVYFGTGAGNNVGTQSVSIGYQAAAGITAAAAVQNVVIGYQAMQNASGTSGGYNVAIGAQVLQGDVASATGGYYNLGLGGQALQDNTSGYYNTAVGSYSLQLNTTGYNNTAVGYGLPNNTTGYNNTALGQNTMNDNTTGNDNIGIGFNAMYSNTSGTFNIVIGEDAMYSSQTASNNIAIGKSVMPYGGTSAAGGNNIAIGNGSMGNTNPTFGLVGYNVALGVGAIGSGNSPSYNTAIGYDALNSDANPAAPGANGNQNVAVGYEALMNNEGGANNTALGYEAAINTTFSATNATNDVAVGSSALSTNTSGSDNTAVGAGANVATATLTNATAIGFQAIAPVNNSITLGNTAATSLYLPGYSSAGTLLYTSAATGLVQATTAGTAGQILTSNGTGAPTWATAAAVTPAWDLTGNTVTETLSATSNTYSTNFVGTLNTSSDQPLVFVSEDTYVGSVDAYSGNRNVYLGGPASGPSGFVGNRNQGSNNTGIGESALSSVVSTSGAASDFNVAVGCYSLEHLDGSTQTGASNFDPNTAVGASTLQALTNGVTDEAFGWQAAFNLTSGSRNIALGSSTDYYNQTGNDNVALGDSAMVGSSGNSYGGVVGVGTSALFSNVGSYNTAVGDNALKTNTSGIQNTALGYDANVSANNLTNATAIGYGASAPVSNSITLGNTAATSLYLPGYRSAGTLLYTSAANGLVQSTSVGTSGQVLTSNGTGVPTWTTQTVASPAWSLTGNSGTTPGTNFIGTTDPNDLVFKTNDNEDMRIANSTGYVGIGTNNPTQPLSVAQTTPIPGFNQYVISSSAIQTSQLADYQNVAMYGFAAGGNSFHGYSIGVMGVIHPVSHGGAALYGAINTAAPNFTQTNNFYGIYTDASATVAGVQNTYAAAFMNGNVGIGTATPAQSLEVGVSTGTIRVDGMITGNSFNVATAPANSNIVIANNSTGDLSALASGANGSVLTLNSSGVPTWAANSVSTIAWTLTGNAGTTPGTNFLGTTDGAALMFKAQDSIAGVIDLTNRNAYYGTNAGNYGGGATNSVVIGYNAGKANTAADNQFIGYKAGQSNTTGDENQFEGFKAGNSNTANSGNYFSGYQAGYNSTGDDPTYGYNANMAIGPNALYGNTTGINNLAIGSTTYEGDAGPSTGDFNEVVGINAMNYITTGSENLAVGQNAMYYTEAGNNNTALGVTAEWQTQGNNNTATGGGAMFGFSSNQSVPSTGNDNTANGAEALDSYTSGSQNSAVGSGSMYWSNTGTNNTISGYASMFYGLTANENTAYGSFAMANNSTGKDNTAIGFNALSTANVATIQSDYANYAYSLVAPNTGSFNTTVGDSSMLNNVSGNRNTAIGRLALSTNITGSNNTAIGNGANVSIDGLSNATAIGFNASAPASNSVTLGNSSVNALYVPGYSSAGSLLYTSATNGLVAATSVGSAGQVLTSNGTSAPTWSTPSTTVAVTPVTPAMSPYSVLTTDYLIEGNCSGGAITINLPVAATVKGKVYCIVATNASPSANYITVNTAGESIGTYGTTILLENNYEQEYIVSDGANWVVLGSSKM